MRAALLALGFWTVAILAAAEDMRAPSPRRIIYPGEVITETMLTDAPLVADRFRGPVVLAPEDILGMVAVRTLLPGHSIPVSAISMPKIVRAGASVKMIYIDGGLTITTDGDALQDGTAGQTIKLRNADSGVVVSGRINSDGTVVVGGG